MTQTQSIRIEDHFEDHFTELTDPLNVVLANDQTGGVREMLIQLDHRMTSHHRRGQVVAIDGKKHYQKQMAHRRLGRELSGESAVPAPSLVPLVQKVGFVLTESLLLGHTDLVRAITHIIIGMSQIKHRGPFARVIAT